MNVEDPAFEMVDEDRRQDTHEAGKYDEVRLVSIQRLDEGRIELLAVGEVDVPDALLGDTGFARTLEAIGVGLVAEDDGNVQIEVARRRAVDERLQIGAAAGDEDGGLHALATGHQVKSTGPSPSAM